MSKYKIAVLGGGLAGSCAALKLAEHSDFRVSVYDKQSIPINSASLHNEGKLHLGYVYGADPDSVTHRIMVEGSLSFLEVIESLTSISRETFSLSLPFTYCVPKDSQLSLKEQSEHFERVDQCIEVVSKENCGSQKLYPSSVLDKSSLLTSSELGEKFSSNHLQGALRTGEYSVNTSQVSNVVGASLLSSSAKFVGDTEVLSASKLEGGEYELRIRNSIGEEKTEKYDAVINCLWEDRLRIDGELGIEPPRPWLVRYKAAISGFSDLLLRESEKYPSVTLITGAYGDFVNHGDGRFYLSWYPRCKLGESQGLSFPEIESAVASLDREKLVKESFSEMSQYFPNLKNISCASENISVGGGYIFAWGKSDITDPVSGLHQRHLIGVDVHDRWLSVNTGKYCTAPLFGVRAAESLLETLS